MLFNYFFLVKLERLKINNIGFIMTVWFDFILVGEACMKLPPVVPPRPSPKEVGCLPCVLDSTEVSFFCAGKMFSKIFN